MADRIQEILFEVTEAPEGGVCARALGASILTQADDLEALKVAVQDASSATTTRAMLHS
jgi:hypothetical protein